MFHVHFHFEESYAAWIQAVTAVFGVVYLIKAYKQANKSHVIQITALRNTIRPELKLVHPTSMELIHAKSDHLFKIGIEILNKPAVRLKITPIKSDLFTFRNWQGEFTTLYFDQADVNKRIVFWIDMDWGIYYKLTTEENPTKSEIKLSFEDQNGYYYQQSIIFSISDNYQNEPELTDIKYL